MPDTSSHRRGQALDYDVVLTSSTGIRVGLMSARVPGPDGSPGRKQWQVDEIPIPNNFRVSESGTGHTDFPPEMEAVVFRDTHVNGMGTPYIATGKGDYYSGSIASYAGMMHLPPQSSEITLPSSEGDVRVMREALSSLYISDGRYLHRSTDGSAFTQVLDVGAGNVITDAIGYGAADAQTGVVVAVQDSTGAALDHYYSTDGTTFVQVTTDASRRFHLFFTKDATLYGLENNNTFRSTTDPYVAAPTWGSATQVGDEDDTFTAGTVVAGVLVLFKQDRVYTVDATGAVSTLVAQFADNPGSHNFGAVTVAFNSNVYFTVSDEVWEYDPVSGELQTMGLLFLPDTSFDPSGTEKAGLAYDGGALYALHREKLTNGTSIVRITQGAEGFVFERWLTTTPSAYRPQGPFHATRLFSSRQTGKALYFNTTTAGKIGVLELFKAHTPYLDTGSRYTTVPATFRSGWMNHNFPGQMKDYTEVTLDVGGLSGIPPRTKVDVYYYLDGDLTTRYTLKTGVTTNTMHQLEFSTGVSGRSFMLELILTSEDTQVTPIVFSWTVRASVKFRIREVITIVARISDNVYKRNGSRDPQTAQGIRNALRALRDSANITISYTDWRGYTFPNIRILPGFQEIEAVDSPTSDETYLTLRMMRVTAQTAGLFIVGDSEVASFDLIG